MEFLVKYCGNDKTVRQELVNRDVAIQLLVREGVNVSDAFTCLSLLENNDVFAVTVPDEREISIERKK